MEEPASADRAASQGASHMVSAWANSSLARKDNHPTLHGEGQLLCEDIKADHLASVTSAHHATIDADHGRLETRHSWITSDIEC